jgi:hypothetical protein
MAGQELEVRKEIAMTQRGVKLSSVSDVWRTAKLLHAGGMVPQNLSREAAAGVILKGMELGLGPLQALENICCINNRFSIYGNGVTALLLRSGLMPKRPEETIEGEGEMAVAVCKMWRKGWADPIEKRFSWQDAKRAGLTGKDNWRKYPLRMLRWRAFGLAARDGFSDVLQGIYLAEEAMDFEPATAVVSELPPELPAAPAQPSPPTEMAVLSQPVAPAAVPPPEEVMVQEPPPPPPPPPAAPKATVMKSPEAGDQGFEVAEAPPAPEPQPEAQVTINKEPDDFGEEDMLGDEEPEPDVSESSYEELLEVWLSIKESLTDPQKSKIREKTGIAKLKKNKDGKVPIKKLRAVVEAAQEILGTAV